MIKTAVLVLLGHLSLSKACEAQAEMSPLFGVSTSGNPNQVLVVRDHFNKIPGGRSYLGGAGILGGAGGCQSCCGSGGPDPCCSDDELYDSDDDGINTGNSLGRVAQFYRKPKEGCCFCSKRDPSRAYDEVINPDIGDPPGNGSGGIGGGNGGIGTDDCCIINKGNIDLLRVRLERYRTKMKDDVELIFSRVNDRLD